MKKKLIMFCKKVLFLLLMLMSSTTSSQSHNFCGPLPLILSPLTLNANLRSTNSEITFEKESNGSTLTLSLFLRLEQSVSGIRSIFSLNFPKQSSIASHFQNFLNTQIENVSSENGSANRLIFDVPKNASERVSLELAHDLETASWYFLVVSFDFEISSVSVSLLPLHKYDNPKTTLKSQKLSFQLQLPKSIIIGIYNPQNLGKRTQTLLVPDTKRWSSRTFFY